MTHMRGFIALIPVLSMSMLLLTLTIVASEEAFLVRYRTMQAEYAVTASTHARSCALAATLVLNQVSARPVGNEEVLLDRGERCRIDSVDYVDDQYELYTSADEGPARRRWYTKAVLEGATVSAISREI